ncbi:hypothetical protein BG004_007978 [Podila humilis]|nr:hypothetical protein BG004_007978 [Podila humilis]
MDELYNYFETLSKESYFLPTVAICVSIAVLITVIQDKAMVKQEKEAADAKKAAGGSSSASSSDNEENTDTHKHPTTTTSDASAAKSKAFALPTTELPPPNTTRVFTYEELSKHDGKDADTPIYVAIKGTVFDVTAKRAMYGPGSGYSCFAGKDASKALGKSSLKVEECVPDYSELTEKELKTLNDWYSFFEKRYPIVGKTEGMADA